MTRDTSGRNLISIHPRQCDCPTCLQEWGDYMEGRRKIDRRALTDIELRQAKPATDQEWTEFMDREFPKVQS